MEDSQEIEEQVQEEVISDNGTEKKQETRDEMLSQHRPVCSLCLKIIPTRSKKESKNVVSCSGSSKVNAVLEFVLELQICGGDFICVLDPQWIYWHYSKSDNDGLSEHQAALMKKTYDYVEKAESFPLPPPLPLSPSPPSPALPPPEPPPKSLPPPKPRPPLSPPPHRPCHPTTTIAKHRQPQHPHPLCRHQLVQHSHPLVVRSRFLPVISDTANPSTLNPLITTDHFLTASNRDPETAADMEA
ncbi:hypothetical protein Ahy_B06g080509 [Arachis hypogaea]|uniref:Uncharacterized protein n=2 Tax=Arachis hypogaea TaxID=3818 RepID=A0A444YI64_ARAHY|nr:hypothetical protein Ahy_B06g080509 [Arachis hypogaea]